MSSLIKVGSRVARGKDWKWENTDGGPGELGTVRKPWSSIADSTFAWLVEWDQRHGYQLMAYRMKNGKYDLTLAECYGK